MHSTLAVRFGGSFLFGGAVGSAPPPETRQRGGRSRQAGAGGRLGATQRPGTTGRGTTRREGPRAGADRWLRARGARGFVSARVQKPSRRGAGREHGPPAHATTQPARPLLPLHPNPSAPGPRSYGCRQGHELTSETTSPVARPEPLSAPLGRKQVPSSPTRRDSAAPAVSSQAAAFELSRPAGVEASPSMICTNPEETFYVRPRPHAVLPSRNTFGQPVECNLGEVGGLRLLLSIPGWGEAGGVLPYLRPDPLALQVLCSGGLLHLTFTVARQFPSSAI